MTATAGYLFEGADWDFSKLQRIHDACEEIARSELGLEIYPNQIEVITAEQMLDAYSSVGMPLFYKHWSFGRHFAHHEAFYRGPPVGSVHRCRCHRLAVVLRRCGQRDYREVGAAARCDFIAAARKPGATRAAEPTYRSGGRGEDSTSTTSTSGSDRTGRRRADRRRPVARVDAVAPVDGARSRNPGARNRAGAAWDPVRGVTRASAALRTACRCECTPSLVRMR
jgi:hypothetical protein